MMLRGAEEVAELQGEERKSGHRHTELLINKYEVMGLRTFFFSTIELKKAKYQFI